MIVEEVKTCVRNEGTIMRKAFSAPPPTASGESFSILSNTQVEIACTVKTSISQQRNTARYNNLIGTLSIYQKTKRCSRRRQSSTDKRIWILQLWFLSRCIEIQYSKTLGTISFSLRSYPILPSSHPIFQMCIDGDVIGLRSMFSSGNISPYSVSAVEGQHIAGRSLLHVGATPKSAFDRLVTIVSML